MDWSAYIDPLQFVLKKFDSVATSTDNLLIWYYWNALRPSICVLLNEKDRNLDNWQVVVKQAVDTKAKIAQQALLLAQKRNTQYACSYRLPKHKESKDEKNFKANKNYFSTANSIRWNDGQSGQALCWFSKKNFYLNKRDQQGQSSNISTTAGNATFIKRSKK